MRSTVSLPGPLLVSLPSVDQDLEQFTRGGQHYNEEVKVKKKEESDRSNKGRHNGARNVLGQRLVYTVRSGAQEPY